MTQQKRMQISDEVQSALKAEKRRTAIGPLALLREYEGEAPEGLTRSIIQRVTSGEAHTCDSEHLNWMFGAYKAADIRLAISADLKETISRELYRTGIRYQQLFEIPTYPLPAGLTLSNFWSWFAGKTKTVKESHYQWIMRTYASLPDNPIFEITDAHLSLLKSEFERTGAGSSTIMRGTRNDVPLGFSSGITQSWLNGEAKTAKQEHWDWLIDTYANHKPNPDIAALTPEILGQLMHEKTRTGTTPPQLFKNSDTTAPDGLFAHTISNWLKGRVQNVPKLYLNFVLSEYRKLPDGGYMVALTKERLDELNAGIEQTGCGPARIARLARKPLPKGLNSSLISKWRSGKVASAKRAQWDHVIEIFEAIKRSQAKK